MLLTCSSVSSGELGYHTPQPHSIKCAGGVFSALKKIRTEGTDKFLIAFFFQTAIKRMKEELAQKRKNSLPIMFF